jgi:hypothetical protein
MNSGLDSRGTDASRFKLASGTRNRPGGSCIGAATALRRTSHDAGSRETVISVQFATLRLFYRFRESLTLWFP